MPTHGARARSQGLGPKLLGGGSVPVAVPPVFNPYTKITAWLSAVEICLSYSYKFDTVANRPIAATF